MSIVRSLLAGLIIGVFGVTVLGAVAVEPPIASGPELRAPSPVQAALDEALGDERHAIAFYTQVMARYGARRPFANIVRAERRHEAALLEQYRRLGLTPPADPWKERTLAVPATFREACDAAEFAEIDNVRIYDRLLAAVDDDAVRRVFRSLRVASLERHLPAFRRHGSGWRVLDPAQRTPAQRAQAERAASARDDLFTALSTKLMNELNTNGAAAAVAVCRDAAPGLAADVARRTGVAIGRTSWKLRNPKNTAPGWTTLVFADRPEEPKFLADRGGRLGFVAPIRVMDACLACHGPHDAIAPDVRTKLETLYPEDRATGFAAGDLRGWFWVEVPAATGR